MLHHSHNPCIALRWPVLGLCLVSKNFPDLDRSCWWCCAAPTALAADHLYRHLYHQHCHHYHRHVHHHHHMQGGGLPTTPPAGKGWHGIAITPIFKLSNHLMCREWHDNNPNILGLVNDDLPNIAKRCHPQGLQVIGDVILLGFSHQSLKSNFITIVRDVISNDESQIR